MADEEIIGGGGNGSAGQSQEQIAAAAAGAFDWQGQLGDTFKDNPDFQATFTKEFTNDPDGVKKLATGYAELQKKVGERGLTKLPDGATDEQKKQWEENRREVLGVPKDKTGYGELPAEVDGMKADSKTREWFLDQALKIGLTPDQVKQLDAASFGLIKELSGDAAKDDAEFATAAKNRFGTETDAKMKEAQVLIAANVSPEFKPLVAKLDNNALLVMTDVILSQQTKLGSEDLPGTGGGGAAHRGADELHAEKLQLMNSPAYKNAFDPQHKDVTKRVLDLNEQVVKMREAGKK